MRSSERISQVQSAVIQDIKALPRRPDTISLGQGVPFFGPPPEVLDTLESNLRKPESHYYSPDAGIPPLREAISGKLSRENGIDASPEREIVVTTGGNQAFFNILLAITDPGDDVILLRPYYFNHEMAIRMLSCTPVIVDCDSKYQPDPEALEKAITKKTRAIVTNSPNNPTGAVYPEKLLGKINALCAQHKIYHISDEAYEHFTYDGARHYSPGAGSEAAGHTFSIFSLSKSFGMAGWRIGYMTVPETLFDDIIKAQDTIVICPSTFLQEAAIEAIKLGGAYPRRFLSHIERSRGVFLKRLEELAPGVGMPDVRGGYYFLPRVETERKALGCVKHLLKEHGVEVVPGDAFGCSNGTYLRLSYGNVAEDAAREGMRRFSEGILELTGR